MNGVWHSTTNRTLSTNQRKHTVDRDITVVLLPTYSGAAAVPTSSVLNSPALWLLLTTSSGVAAGATSLVLNSPILSPVLPTYSGAAAPTYSGAAAGVTSFVLNSPAPSLEKQILWSASQLSN